MTVSYLLDTNVLLRASDPTHRMHSVSVGALDRLRASGAQLCITSQIVIEYWAVATRSVTANGLGWTPHAAAEVVASMVDQVRLLEENSDIFSHWLTLVTEHRVTGKRVHDVRLLAVMRAHRVSHLLTFNTGDFPPVEGITIIAPAEVV